VTSNLCPVQRLHKFLEKKELPHFGLKQWKWETDIRLDPEREQISQFYEGEQGFIALRKIAKKYWRRNILLMLIPMMFVVFYFCVLVAVAVSGTTINEIPRKFNIAGAIITIVAFILTIIGVKPLNKLMKHIDPKEMSRILGNVLNEHSTSELDYYVKPKKMTITLALLIFIIGMLASIFLPSTIL